MKRKRVIFAFAGFALLLMSSLARPDSPAPPQSWQKQTADGLHTFVMAVPEGYGWQQDEESSDGPPESGLYRDDDMKTPLWTVDWYAFSAELSHDGRYLVRPGPWASHTGGEAFSFFDKGKLLRTYRICELVADMSKLRHTTSHFGWLRRGASFDEEKSIYTVATLDDRTYRFDATTGTLIEGELVPEADRSCDVRGGEIYE